MSAGEPLDTASLAEVFEPQEGACTTIQEHPTREHSTEAHPTEGGQVDIPVEKPTEGG